MFSFFNKPSKNEKSSGYFIQKGSEFVEFENGANKSINDVANLLGYKTDEIHTHHVGYDVNNDDLQVIVFETFTLNVIFIVTRTGLTKLKSKQVKAFTKNLSFNDIYPDYTIEGVLEDGIENKSLSIEFLHKVLHLNDNSANCFLNSDKIGYFLEFNDGFLIDYQPSDSLNKWAREWKKNDPKYIELYEKDAQKYWGKGNISKIVREVNAQFDSYANIPQALQNPYIKKHTNKTGLINFLNLRIAHYEYKISMDDFMELNHGRFEPYELNSENIAFEIGEFVYEFNNSGELEKVFEL